MANFVYICVFISMLSVGYGMKMVKIKECEPNKYFWKDEGPKEFYACLSMKEKAVHMRCTDGTYMCNTGEKTFQPCACKGTPPGMTENDLLAKQGPGGPRLSAQDFAKEGNDPSFALTDLKTKDLQNAILAPRTFESLPANGCPDPFEVTTNGHMFQGVQQPDDTLTKCQRRCSRTRNCIGIDWDKLPDTPDDNRCFFIFPESTRFGLDPMFDFCCDHYRRTNCQSTPVAPAATPAGTDGDSATPPNATPNPVTPDGGDMGGMGEDNNGQGMDGVSPGDAKNGDAQAQAGGDPGFGGVAGSPVPVTNPPPVSTPAIPMTTTTIPDSGCPYTFQKYVSTSHPFGVNITRATQNRDEEDCKDWCLIRSFCAAVDFNANLGTCYMLREINPSLTMFVPGVTHYRKMDCPPPLKCYDERIELESEDQLSVTDPATNQTKCQGVCFVRQTMESSHIVIERGCMEVNNGMAPGLGCTVDNSLMSVSCFCDTPRCNGLSITAMSSQLLHLPLDGDMSDHSGIGHTGVIPPGYNEPSFTCLDKAVNCSAIFSGNECISVESLAQTEWGTTDNSTHTFIPQATFAVWFKRVAYQSNRQQGIFGTSVDDNTPTWRIIADKYDDYVGGGILTDSATFSDINDYKYVYGENDQWHLAVMTYIGYHNASLGQFPLLKFYLDGNAMPGNARSDDGKISVRAQPVTVGCVNEENFTGFIDEARIFSTALDVRDIRALIAMRDTNYW